MKNKVTAVIMAAGQGKRMNTPVAKQFIMLEDKPVLFYSIKSFEDSLVDEIIIVCGHGQIDYCTHNIIEPYGFKKITRIVEGGKERYDSVRLALSAIEQTDYVLIHDGARPFISTALINEVIQVVRQSKACIVAAPVKDTIKIVDKDGWIKETPDREYMWMAQTPQAFEYSSIRRAYALLFEEEEADRKVITDDAMVYERYIKRPVKIVKGDYNNIKLTTPDDLILAQEIKKQAEISKSFKL
ncbi:MAG: 2-C-methyl-D-erythritol 4-phosphate cytidylyltransferase [Clostridiales bacterium]|jgi:2-C-methyl-D-erythritol 4-phosphate cytidylyltransferase|nr:2-C-methyl-D-erythritol 4-phosphate cytidylyltransferase [Clostridiales bacterium]